MLGPIKNYLNENGWRFKAFPLSAERIGQLIALIDEGKTNFSVGSLKISPAMLNAADKTPLEIAEELNLLQSNDEGLIKAIDRRGNCKIS
jgi:aspartyl-tRNA(Asn)/glutamyl-tRNA(Gln) amidotransferase subunit B